MYIWDKNVLLHEIKKEGKQKDEITTWVFEGFIPTAKLVNGKSYSIITDHIGRPIQAIDDNGELVWSCDYDIYGRLKKLKGERTFISFRQVGQIEDSELEGLYYNRYRWYNSETGTYISQDPISIAGGLNLYSYVHNSNSWIDPLGLTGHLSFIGEALHPATITSDNPGGLIKIQATGSHAGDKVAVYEKTKNKDVWSDDYRVHHVSYDPKTNEMTMQIVKKDYHKIGHTGGAKDFKDDTGFKYNTQEAIDEATKRRNKNGCNQ
ncbi:RHS repeat domain-containing protein [Treponema pedis]|uniref:RHS repeat domain-containing protein n=2 Tax=Treponema pedis TaxID=409322 RepID=UPI0003FF6C0D|nr:RHS repeat-associated core domain-containing protein [Treponema pedis]